MNLPRHSGQDDEPHVIARPSRTKQIVVAVAVLAILVAMLVLHLTGVIHGH